MLIKIRRGWELPERAATPEDVFHDRRRLLKAAVAGPILLAAPGLLAGCDDPPERIAQLAEAAGTDAPGGGDPSASLYPFQRNLRYRLDRDITDEKTVNT